MKFLGQYFGIILGICLIGYATFQSIDGPSGAAFAGLLGFAIVVASMRYRRFTIPFMNSPIERRRRQTKINPKYDRRVRSFR